MNNSQNHEEIIRLLEKCNTLKEEERNGGIEKVRLLEEDTIAQEAYEFAALLYGAVYTALISYFWVNNYLSGSTSVAINQAILVLNIGIDALKAPAMLVVFLFLLISNIRVMLGSFLCNSDTSDLRANVLTRHKADKNKTLSKLKSMFSLIKLIAFCSLLRYYAFSATTPYLMPLILVIETGIILVFDYMFSWEIKHDRKSNPIDAGKATIQNDAIIFFISFCWFIFVWSNVNPIFSSLTKSSSDDWVIWIAYSSGFILILAVLKTLYLFSKEWEGMYSPAFDRASIHPLILPAIMVTAFVMAWFKH